jgi:tetratricopeptide (TPR) repeat protein
MRHAIRTACFPKRSVNNGGMLNHSVKSYSTGAAIVDDSNQIAADLAEAIAYAKFGQHQEALRLVTDLLRRAPRDALSWRFKGETLFELGRYADAAACFRRSAQVAGALTGDIYIWLACAESNAGQRDQAIADLQLALFNAGRRDQAFRDKAGRLLRAIREDRRRFGNTECTGP